uniref:Uncharacterized protein n=1 Tax=Knipowitschia caucasica TaxID=637954 RepID=A0AAV2MJQ1_KNICA
MTLVSLLTVGERCDKQNLNTLTTKEMIFESKTKGSTLLGRQHFCPVCVMRRTSVSKKNNKEAFCCGIVFQRAEEESQPGGIGTE